MKLGNAWSSWVSPQDKTSPWDPEGTLPWTGYLNLAAAVQNNGMYWEALRIINLIADVLDAQIASEAYEKLIANCTLSKYPMKDKLAKIAALTALCIHEAKHKKYSRARHAYERAVEELSDVGFSREALKSCSLGLDLEWAQLMAWPNADRMVTARTAERLGRLAQKSSNFGRADVYFTEACEISLQVHAWDEFSAWRETQENFTSLKMEDLPDLIMGRARHWRFGKTTDQNALVEWFDNFERTHQLDLAVTYKGTAKSLIKQPVFGEEVFDVPLVLYMKESSLIQVFKRIKKADRESWSKENLQKLEKDIPQADLIKHLPKYLQDWYSGELKVGFSAIQVLMRQISRASQQGVSDDALLASILGPVNLESAGSEESKVQALFHFFYAAESVGHWPERRLSIHNWLSLDREYSSSRAATFLEAQLQLIRCLKSSSPQDAITQNQEFINLVYECHDEARNFLHRNMQNSRSFIGLMKLTLIGDAEPPEAYDEIVQIHSEILYDYVSNPDLQRFALERANQYIRLADICQRKRRVHNDPSLETIEGYLQGAETAFDEYRQDTAAMQPAEAFKEKSRISTILDKIVDLEKVGYRVYRLELLRRPSERIVKEKLWNWIQRSKGRALTDALGLRMQAPTSSSENIKSEAARKLLSRWEKLKSEVSQPIQISPSSLNASDIYYLRKQLHDTANEMRQFDDLRDIADLAEGRTIKSDELGQLFAKLKNQKNHNGGEILLLDWFEVSDILGNVQWYLAMVRSTSERNQQFSIEIKKVPNLSRESQFWISDFLTPLYQNTPNPGETSPQSTTPSQSTGHHAGKKPSEQMISVPQRLKTDEAYAKLQTFQPLLHPLSEILGKRDTVVLCPFRKLHRLPLHAIELPEIGDEPLICQNRVVYCHSISILRQTALSWESQYGGLITSPNTKAAGIFPLHTGLNDYSLRQSFEDAFDGEYIADEQVQKQTFVEASDGATDLFFLGHVHDNRQSPLESHICLYELALHDTTQCTGARAVSLTAGEILDLILLCKGAHVSWIACASGVASSLSSEDYLCIVPATLYAGARSTISTLWPIYQIDGVDFSKILFEQIEENPGSRVNRMADSMREAVLELRRCRGEKNLGAWAGFVFHGF